MKKLLKIVIILIVLLAFTTVSGLTYLGFMPGVSAVFGTNKAKDLKTVRTVENVYAAAGKLKFPLTFKELEVMLKNPNDYKKVTASLDANEISSLMATSSDKSFPFTEMTFRINPDNSVEASGYARPEKIAAYLAKTHVPQETIKRLVLDDYFLSYLQQTPHKNKFII